MLPIHLSGEDVLDLVLGQELMNLLFWNVTWNETFSHEFEKMPLQSFWDPDNARCNFSVSQENGKKKSSLCSRAHIHCDRQVELDDVCLHDFFSMHTIGEKQGKKKNKKKQALV